VDVGVVARDDVGVQVGGGAGDDGVGDVAGGCSAHEFAGGVGLLFGQGGDVASAQQAAELDLAGGAADLGDDGRGDDGDDSGFEPDPVIGQSARLLRSAATRTPAS
jgi:hypothetical protein